MNWCIWRIYWNNIWNHGVPRFQTKRANEFQWFLNSAVCDSCLQWACSCHVTTQSISPQLWRQRSFQIMNANLCHQEAPDWSKFAAKDKRITQLPLLSAGLTRVMGDLTFPSRPARWLAGRRQPAFPCGRYWQSGAGLPHWGGGWPGSCTQHDSSSWGTPWFDIRFHYIFHTHAFVIILYLNSYIMKEYQRDQPQGH